MTAAPNPEGLLELKELPNGYWAIEARYPEDIEQGGLEAAELEETLYGTRDEGLAALARLKEILYPAPDIGEAVYAYRQVPPVGVAQDSEGLFVLIFTYKVSKTICGHIEAKRISRIADLKYSTKAEAVDAANKIYDLIGKDIK